MIQLDTIYNEDCLEGMKRIPDGSVDAVIADPPYGTTSCAWDSVIPLEPLWNEFRRVIKPTGIIALFATQPFTTLLIASNMKDYRYNWIWEKDSPNGFLNANYAPLKITEDICVFAPYTTIGSLSKNPIKYNPQGVREVNRRKRNNPNSVYRASQGYAVGGNKLNSDSEYTQRYEGYPNNILRFPHDKGAIHPTQKPVDLIRYLVLTYTDVGGVVLDSCMGSGTTAIACLKEHRHFLGFELNKEYFDIAQRRIALERQQPQLDFTEDSL